jgi:hypothetical protein
MAKGFLDRIGALLGNSAGKKEPLRLAEVMRRRAACLPDPLTAEQKRDLEAAKRRCADCNSGELCDELLARGAKEGYGRFCPNAAYVEQLRDHSLKFDK